MREQNQNRQAALVPDEGQYQEQLFTREEWHTLIALRDSYAQDHDLLSASEHARLRFVRWLIQTGRIEP